MKNRTRKWIERDSPDNENKALRQKGFLGIESARDNELGITISYWSL